MIRRAIRRRLVDVDSDGRISGVAFQEYLQEARRAVLRDVAEISNQEYAQVVVRQEVTHVRPLAWGENPVYAEIRVSAVARTSYTLGYRIEDSDGTLLAEAVSVLASVDAKTGRLVRLPEALRERLVLLAQD